MSTFESLSDAPRVRLFKGREKVFPQAVSGPYRRFKWIVLGLTLAIYYITPWLRWDRGPNAPDQAVLVDLAHRRFYFGPIEIWPQEFYYIGGLLMMAGIGLFLVTSTVGRAWCGYACPQTVWTDLFMAVERWIEGDRNARIRLDRAPWTLSKIAKRVAVHSSWLLIAVATGGAWVFYFADAPTLAHDLFTGTAAFVAYASIAVLTATTYVFGGLMREQVCTYMCPWPRIQAAMLDENSLIVTYKAWRGEPRGRGVKKAELSDLKLGDCVDCNACVAVCPMGIDIRNGPQLECITCGLCIDACNNVMDKLVRPAGLIDYSTVRRDQAEAAGETLAPKWRAVVRPRTLIYFTIWALIGVAMAAKLATRSDLDLAVDHDRNPLFVQLADGSIRNGYTLKLLNKTAQPREVVVTVAGLPGARIWDSLSREAQAGASLRIAAGPDRLETRRIYVRVPRSAIDDERIDFRFVARAADGEQAARPTRFDSPED